MPSRMRAIFLSIFCTSVTVAAFPGTAQWVEMDQKRDYVFVRPGLDNGVVFEDLYCFFCGVPAVIVRQDKLVSHIIICDGPLELD